jgi:phage terminase large subunit
VAELRIQTPAAYEPLLQPSRYKGAYGGRGSGKSHFFAELLIEQSIMRRIDAVCIREVQRTLAQSVKKLIEQKIEALNVGGYFEVQDKRITSRAGGVIIFEGMQNHTADSIKSLEGFDLAWVEEAQSLSARSLELLRPTIRKPASELWFGWNPSLPTDPVDELLRGSNPPPGAVVVRANYTDNPWFPDVLRQEMEYDRARDPDKFAHVWLGEYQRNSEARVFRNWRVEEFDVGQDWVLRQGADFGFSIDPSVLVQCAIIGRTLYVAHEAYQIGCEIDLLPDLFRTVPDAERWTTIADSSRPETISYLQRHGFRRILPAVKGARSLEEGVEFLKAFEIVVHPRCRHLIDELTLYSYKLDPLTGRVLPMLEDKHNHGIDALRYACEAARRAKPAGMPAQRATTDYQVFA